ncbi:MAG: MFS transporter, partial [Candidatus Omnitrophota bacterium]
MEKNENSYLDVLKNGSFIKLWIGQMISYVGDRIAQMAFLAWMIASYHKSAAEMAQITFFSMLPLFLFSGLAGAIADRLSRKWVMVVSNLFRALLVLVIAFVVLRQSLPFYAIYILIFAIGISTAFFVPARLAIIPNIVPAGGLQVANALSAGAGMIATLIGTYFAGVLIERNGFFTGFVVNGAFYIGACLILAWIVVPRRSVSEALTKADTSEKQNIKEVMTYLKNHKRAWELVLLSVALSFISSFFYIGLTVLAVDYLHLGTEGLGKLLSMLGIGMIAGSVFVMIYGKNIKTTYLLIASFGMICFTTITARLVHSYEMAWVWLILLGAANATILILTDTILQKITPDRFRGKVFGFRAMITNGVFLLSLLGVGQLLKITSPFEVFTVLSFTSFAIAIVILFTQEAFGYRIFRAFLRLILKTLFSFQVEGEECLRYRSKVIIAGNHTGLLDSLIVMAAFNRRVSFMTSRKAFSWPVIGKIIQRAGVIPVDDGKGMRAIETAVEQLRRGRVIGIFPEGRVTTDGKIGTFHKGVARLKTESGAPVIPFVIHGGFEAWPWGKKLPKLRKVILQFGQPIVATDKDENKLVRDIKERIQFMKEALERRENLKKDTDAFQASMLDLMQLKSDVYGARTALQLKEKNGWKALSFIELSRQARDLSGY